MFDLPTISVSIFLFSFVSLILISMFVSHAKEVAAESFFFANRNIRWLLLGASFLTSCIFSLFAFGLIASESNALWTIAYGIISAIMLVILAWLLGPLYLKMKINTLPEYFEKRFSRNCRFFLSTVYVFCNIFIKLVVILVLGSFLISKIAGVDPFSPLLFFLFVTGVYVIIGGLRAEIYANVIQVIFIILVIAGIAEWIANQNIGTNSVFHKVASLSHLSAESNSNSSLGGLVVGLPIFGFWSWCADQSIMQKVLSVRSIYSLRRAALFSSILQIIPVVLVTIVGMTLLPRLLPEGTVDTLFVDNSMPEILRVGLMIAVAAALMALFAGIFNSTSLLITFDFYRSFRPSASDRTLLLVGRMTAIVLLLYSILLIPISQTIDFSLCLKLLRIFVYFAALIAAVFAVSLLSRKIRAASALLTLHVGALIVLLRGAVEIIFHDQRFESRLLNWFARSNSLEFAVFVFVLSILLLFVFQKSEIVQRTVISFQRTVKTLFPRLRDKQNSRKTVV